MYGKYLCLKCGHKWKSKLVGPKLRCVVNCGSKYIKWVNYEALKASKLNKL